METPFYTFIQIQNTKYKSYTMIWNTVCQTDSS